MIKLNRIVNYIIKENSDVKQFYHGTPDKKRILGKKGIHVGTKLAATQALEARIGVPAEGEWDGTRKYGDTLLAGKNRLKELKNERGYYLDTGYNTMDVPEDNYYPDQRKTKASYSDGKEIPLDAIPDIIPVDIIGPMTNTINTPHTDVIANALIKRSLSRGNAKKGFYYVNDGEDTGSVSAVVPDTSFLKIKK